MTNTTIRSSYRNPIHSLTLRQIIRQAREEIREDFAAKRARKAMHASK